MTETISHIAARKLGDHSFTVFPDVDISVDDNNCMIIHAKNISNKPLIQMM